MKKLRKAWGAFFQHLAQRPRLRLCLGAALVLMMTALQWLQLDLSCGTRIIFILQRKWFYPFVNMGLVFTVDLALLLITRRWRIAYILGSIFFFVWGVADHYTWLFSGNVLTLTALRSVGTALDVLGGYRFAPDLAVIVSVFGAAVNVCAALILGRLWPGPLSWRRTGAAAGCLVLLLAAVVAGIPVLERIDPPALWTASDDLNAFGYPVYFVEQASMSFGEIQRPAWYDESVVDAIEPRHVPSASTGQAPDIVLILNESYYFLDDYTDIAADVSYTEGWDDLHNAVRGRAIVPGAGGGTNQTEYELLNSNSMHCSPRGRRSIYWTCPTQIPPRTIWPSLATAPPPSITPRR